MAAAKQVLTPQDFTQEDKENNIRNSDEFAEMFEGMSQKQVNLVIATLTNPTDTKLNLAKKAGYKVAEGSKINHLFKPIQGKLGKSLLHLGITEMDLLSKVNELLHAKKSIVIGDKVIEPPDYAIQLKTLQMIFTLGSYFPAGRIKVDHTHGGEITFGESMDLESRKAHEAKLVASEQIDAEYEVADEIPN